MEPNPLIVAIERGDPACNCWTQLSRCHSTVKEVLVKGNKARLHLRAFLIYVSAVLARASIVEADVTGIRLLPSSLGKCFKVRDAGIGIFGLRKSGKLQSLGLQMTACISQL